MVDGISILGCGGWELVRLVFELFILYPLSMFYKGFIWFYKMGVFGTFTQDSSLGFERGGGWGGGGWCLPSTRLELWWRWWSSKSLEIACSRDEFGHWTRSSTVWAKVTWNCCNVIWQLRFWSFESGGRTLEFLVGKSSLLITVIIDIIIII